MLDVENLQQSILDVDTQGFFSGALAYANEVKTSFAYSRKNFR